MSKLSYRISQEFCYWKHQCYLYSLWIMWYEKNNLWSKFSIFYWTNYVQLVDHHPSFLVSNSFPYQIHAWCCIGHALILNVRNNVLVALNNITSRIKITSLAKEKDMWKGRVLTKNGENAKKCHAFLLEG